MRTDISKKMSDKYEAISESSEGIQAYVNEWKYVLENRDMKEISSAEREVIALCILDRVIGHMR